MRVLSFLAERGGLVAMLMIALAVLAAPTPGLADTPDAHSESAVVADNHGAPAGHAASSSASAQCAAARLGSIAGARRSEAKNTRKSARPRSWRSA